MAVGKNKKQGKGGRKGKKKQVDPFLKKEWYDIRAPAMFANRTCGKTLVTKTIGTKIASDGLKGRVVELALSELNKDSDHVFRKFQLQIEDVQGRQCLTNFYGMTLSRDKLCSLVKKWQSTIEAYIDVRTTDAYSLRVFVIGFTKNANPRKKHCYAQSQQIRMIRRRMVDIVRREFGTCELKDVVNKLIPDSVGKDVEHKCSSIYPLHEVMIRKVKVLRKPKFDPTHLLKMHGEYGSSAGAGGAAVDGDAGADGAVVSRPDNFEPPVQMSV